MQNLKWYANRLRAMSPAEICWRSGQKYIQWREKRRFAKQRPVSEALFFSKKARNFNPLFLGEGFFAETRELPPVDLSAPIPDWNGRWPMKSAYELDYKGFDEAGDARSNWEINRHFEFPRLAQMWAADGNSAALQRLDEMLSSWNAAAPMLWGISWTSVMEVAIRAIQWMTTLAFLKAPGSHEPADDAQRQQLEKLEKALSTGAQNMVEYVWKHYSRYSSANNHLLVEMTAILLAGYAFDCREWQSRAAAILDAELAVQNTLDGVNRESSLHYHVFVMEAYALAIMAMEAAGTSVPRRWKLMLGRMAQFLAHSTVNPGTVCEFGDDDAGCILNLHGFHDCRQQPTTENDYYTHILHLAKTITGEEADSRGSKTFATGGYTFLKTDRIYVGIDHAPHGFGTIAAHAHDDALSFQLFIDGRPVMTDPGTSLYHCNRPERDRVRRAEWHNTIVINSTDPSEILGAFLWGRHPQTELRDYNATSLTASTRGQSGVTHTRSFVIEPQTESLTINDSFDTTCNWAATFITPIADLSLKSESEVEIADIATLLSENGKIEIDETTYYPSYGVEAPCKRILITGNGKSNRVVITPRRQA